MKNITAYIIPNPYQANQVNEIIREHLSESAPVTREIIGYELRDNQTRKVIGKYGPTQGKRARSRRDTLDLEYGAIRYSVIPVYKEI
jgi:hypothetical protein